MNTATTVPDRNVAPPVNRGSLCLTRLRSPSTSSRSDNQQQPLGEPLVEPPGPEAVLVKQPYRLAGVDAVGAPAVGYDLQVAGQLCQPQPEVLDRDGARGLMCPCSYSTSGRTSMTVTASSAIRRKSSSLSTASSSSQSTKSFSTRRSISANRALPTSRNIRQSWETSGVARRQTTFKPRFSAST